MLSDSVLAELVRRSPLQQKLVTSAWPSLSTESRLQVVDAIQRGGGDPSTPSWLLDLAQTDSAEIVRYWAARFYLFSQRSESNTVAEQSGDGGPNPLASLNAGNGTRPEEPAEAARAHAARSDSSDLVRSSAERLGFFNVSETLIAAPQQQRLLAIRNGDQLRFSGFIEWLDAGLKAGVSDPDLYECAVEFFGRPDIASSLREGQAGEELFYDGGVAYFEGKALERAWELLIEGAGNWLGTFLSSVLPVKRGLTTIDATMLAGLPRRRLEAVLMRRNEHPTFGALEDMVRSHPEKFAKSDAQELARSIEDAYMLPSADERTVQRWALAIDRPAANFEALISIRRTLQRLEQRLNDIEEAAGRKRGIFG